MATTTHPQPRRAPRPSVTRDDATTTNALWVILALVLIAAMAYGWVSVNNNTDYMARTNMVQADENAASAMQSATISAHRAPDLARVGTGSAATTALD